MKTKCTSILLLASLLLSTVLTACSGGSTDTDTTVADTTASTTAVETTEKTWRDALPANLDFKNEEVVILARPDGDELCFTEIGGIEAYGDVLNDEFYARNRAIEEQLHVVLTQFEGYNWDKYTDELARIRQSFTSGDNTWQIISGWASQITPLSLENCFKNVLTLDNLDTTQPWWNQSAVNGLQIGGGLYFLAGDICVLSMLGGTWVPFINDELATKYNVEDLAQVVLDGKWTVDKMVETIQKAKSDLNGDGTMDENDLWGLVTTKPNPTDMFGFGADIHQIFIEDGLPVYRPAEEKVATLYEKIYPLFYGKEAASSLVTGSDSNKAVKIFTESQALMTITSLGVSQRTFREMEDDYTILPAPKFDEDQDGYYSYATNGISIFCIPSNNPTPDTAAAVMEVMGAYNYESLSEVYFKVVLQDKFSRNSNSVKMLEIIKDGVYLDCENLYRKILGNTCNVMRNLLAEDNIGVASWYASNLNTINTKVEEAIKTLNALNT